MNLFSKNSRWFISLRLPFATLGSFAFAGYYPELLIPYMPAWAAVGIFVLPVMILVFVNWGEQPGRLVAWAHLGAAIWFLLLSAGMEIGVFMGYRPPGTTLYRVLAHLAWTFSWATVFKTALQRRH